MLAPTVRQVWPWSCAPVEVPVPATLQGYCNVCGNATAFKISSTNLREDVVCTACGSFSRQRQLAAALLALVEVTGRRDHLGDLPGSLRVWNMEASRAFHAALARRLGPGYAATEFVDEGLASGTVVRGVVHADVRRTHFAAESFDVVVSSDVLEHVPGHAAALAEVWRVLRPGGWHVFTAPFSDRLWSNELRARVAPGGAVEHLLPPVYHGDPLRKEGVLVYQVFGLELLHELGAAGFEARALEVHDERLGMLDHGLVLAGRKLAPRGAGEG
jgi:SAM-dependent methyltransferase